jgi:hypothetical protein
LSFKTPTHLALPEMLPRAVFRLINKFSQVRSLIDDGHFFALWF